MGSYRNTTPSNDCLPYEKLCCARERCARGGRGRIRTVVGGFADPCLTTRPRDPFDDTILYPFIQSTKLVD
jgi:hypothetical protein